MVGGERAEVGKRPSAADAAASEDAVRGFAFEPDSATQENDADRESTENFAAGAPGLQLVGEEES